MSMTASLPGYWMYEVSGVLRPAIEAYLSGRDLTAPQIAVIRDYFRQWTTTPYLKGEGVKKLRADVDGLTSRAAIAEWLARALDLGIDPL